MTLRRTFQSLRSRDRRALMLGSLLAVPALVWSLAVKPYMTALGAARETLATERGLLARELGAVQAAPRVPAEIAKAHTALTREHARLFTGDAIAATAALSNYIKEAVDEGGLTLQQLDGREGSPLASGLRDLTLELRAQGDLRGILDLLTTLENGEHLVRVTRLAIEPTAPVQTATEALVVVATLHGYADADASSAGKAP